MEQKDLVPQQSRAATELSETDTKQSKTRKGLLLSLGGIVASSVGGLVFIDLLIQPARDTIAFELAKALLQLGVVAIVGTAVSILVFEYQRSRQNFDKLQEAQRQDAKDRLQKDLADRSYRDELIKSVMTRAVTSYNSVKRARRLLRAKGLIGNRFVKSVDDTATLEVKFESYDEYIEDINDAQLEIEALVREVDTSPTIFGDGSDLAADLKQMEKYLGKLISEYESERPQHAGQHEGLQSFPVLEKFLYPRKSGDAFRAGFARPLESVQRRIRQELLPAAS